MSLLVMDLAVTGFEIVAQIEGGPGVDTLSH